MWSFSIDSGFPPDMAEYKSNEFEFGAEDEREAALTLGSSSLVPHSSKDFRRLKVRVLVRLETSASEGSRDWRILGDDKEDAGGGESGRDPFGSVLHLSGTVSF